MRFMDEILRFQALLLSEEHPSIPSDVLLPPSLHSPPVTSYSELLQSEPLLDDPFLYPFAASSSSAAINNSLRSTPIWDPQPVPSSQSRNNAPEVLPPSFGSSQTHSCNSGYTPPTSIPSPGSCMYNACPAVISYDQLELGVARMTLAPESLPASPAHEPTGIDLFPSLPDPISEKAQSSKGKAPAKPPQPKVLSCPVDGCSMKFAKACTLNRHVDAIHLHLKRFKCRNCGRRFARKDTLKRHTNSRTCNRNSTTTALQSFSDSWKQSNYEQ